MRQGFLFLSYPPNDTQIFQKFPCHGFDRDGKHLQRNIRWNLFRIEFRLAWSISVRIQRHVAKYRTFSNEKYCFQFDIESFLKEFSRYISFRFVGFFCFLFKLVFDRRQLCQIPHLEIKLKNSFIPLPHMTGNAPFCYGGADSL